MGDVFTLAAAIVTTVGGLVAGGLAARRAKRLQARSSNGNALADARERADLLETKYDLSQEDLAKERAAHAETARQLQVSDDARRQCQGDLDNLRSANRASERYTGRRQRDPR